ncbi:UPF0149 family protein [Pseudomonas aeruginosa]|nr:UPF0149 family protein [Pseudomonas aeruginosa]
MSTQNSAYSAFSSLLAEAAMPVSPAELHGHLLGRGLLGGAPGERLKAALSGLLGMVRQDFSAGEVAVVMLLPDDETPLAQRTEALGQWCQGFLAGFGLTAREGSLTGEAEEVLQDMAAIAQVQGQLEDSEDGETDYMEVMEYLRVAPLLLFAECGKPLEPAPKPSLH